MRQLLYFKKSNCHFSRNNTFHPATSCFGNKKRYFLENSVFEFSRLCFGGKKNSGFYVFDVFFYTVSANFLTVFRNSEKNSEREFSKETEVKFSRLPPLPSPGFQNGTGRICKNNPKKLHFNSFCCSLLCNRRPPENSAAPRN